MLQLFQSGWIYLNLFANCSSERYFSFREENPYRNFDTPKQENYDLQSTIYGNSEDIYTLDQYRSRFTCKDSKKNDPHDWICEDGVPVFTNFQLIEILP